MFSISSPLLNPKIGTVVIYLNAQTISDNHMYTKRIILYDLSILVLITHTSSLDVNWCRMCKRYTEQHPASVMINLYKNLIHVITIASRQQFNVFKIKSNNIQIY